ncbi:GNAT family N-acetyltransferase [Micromonospora musae]|uniref:GNAT family N-acetyltransferase n=1 Tax=Micromonospora musae TaxID=1894970 RepID=A0ABX9R523_9ACTN|nr:GNAT family N-acetyltransferase [Micromonospora musae]RKN18270.1 GNAT family N-acetyltransferase [Micromonospora musae]
MVQIRLFRPGDGSAVADLVQRCLREVNSRDYPAEIVERMCRHFSEERIAQLADERQMFVAEQAGIVGTVSRDGNRVFTMFVHPEVTGQGVGRRLMRHIELLAAAEGCDYMETGASITGHGFYRRLGYVDLRSSETEFGLNYILRKALP